MLTVGKKWNSENKVDGIIHKKDSFKKEAITAGIKTNPWKAIQIKILI